MAHKRRRRRETNWNKNPACTDGMEKIQQRVFHNHCLAQSILLIQNSNAHFYRLIIAFLNSLLFIFTYLGPDELQGRTGTGNFL